MNQATFEKQIEELILSKKYSHGLELCHEWFEVEPQNLKSYLYAGLCFLLNQNELDAQAAWMYALSEIDGNDSELKTQLLDLLERVAEDQKLTENHEIAWILRGYIHEFNHENINNLLKMAQLEILQTYQASDRLAVKQLCSLFEQDFILAFDLSLLLQTLSFILEKDSLSHQTFDFVRISANYILKHTPDKCNHLVPLLNQSVIRIRCVEDNAEVALWYAKLSFDLDSKNLTTLKLLSSIYIGVADYPNAIEIAEMAYENATQLIDQMFTKHLLLLALLGGGGYWQKAIQVYGTLKDLLHQLCDSGMHMNHSNEILSMSTPCFLFPHIEDQPKSNRLLSNKIASLSQTNLSRIYGDQPTHFSFASHDLRTLKTRPLRIGYLCSCFRTHPVGFLARWLIKNHDKEKFSIYIYFVAYQKQRFDPIQDWYEHQDVSTFRGDMNVMEIAQKIYGDQIDILIDLDSLTFHTSYEVMALKPSPVQLTWLGFDATGLPSMDYFLADPYVLPDDAQTYYAEKIWRLPHTYLAVEGFEISTPSLTRQSLEIANDAIVYFSGQRGNKRSPHLAQLQIKILNQVPNSYLLIKGKADQGAVQEFFYQLADGEEVNRERIKFLPFVATSEEHRANLAIADVILDTYPYNGATTTLEALWMEIPLVTRVGEQFSARNSYTFLVNAGVSEGIAWTDEEYVEWGIRLGTDEDLRKQVTWKLKKAKQYAPLWDAQQFTREVENAYEAMWNYYVTGNMELPQGHIIG
ncbi:O-linked N-acetylglucosamine transferase, SPINDLY family protein [Candidatus Synechococcus calcipolaris G9]|uniref:O-linked N-acetylglucosamine transferase, SPINDLY family protein n=1 Tax=Candidatus Synechococcus calcipolaris G9 TaxID=1497997 RepID=A0ABT6F0P6_9SYNE|nr:O-linked N-acetylglucosamine transferase, SPINDLY family protein [Candidatus Synechococcus calcipolaris]MDG2991435.1 O-linked N-acetylglucosamine transferase, SPINDLY family protein [Candidatus Synechococcus calcipolaris G9]